MRSWAATLAGRTGRADHALIRGQLRTPWPSRRLATGRCSVNSAQEITACRPRPSVARSTRWACGSTPGRCAASRRCGRSNGDAAHGPRDDHPRRTPALPTARATVRRVRDGCCGNWVTTTEHRAAAAAALTLCGPPPRPRPPAPSLHFKDADSRFRFRKARSLPTTNYYALARHDRQARPRGVHHHRAQLPRGVPGVRETGRPRGWQGEIRTARTMAGTGWCRPTSGRCSTTKAVNGIFHISRDIRPAVAAAAAGPKDEARLKMALKAGRMARWCGTTVICGRPAELVGRSVRGCSNVPKPR